MSDKKEEKSIPLVGYKINAEINEMIKEYFDTRPMSEVDVFFTKMLDINNEDVMFSEESIQALTQYLMDKCPRKHAKPIIEALKKGLEKYDIKPKEEAKS